MKPSRQVTALAGLLLVISMAGSVFFLRRVDQVRAHATLKEVLYISSPQALRRLSLGYTGLLADIYWTRAVQYFGTKLDAGNGEYDLLFPLLQLTTQLDPHLLVAYDYGASFLATPPTLGAGRPREAVELIKYGIQHNPDQWRLYYNLGFVYYIELKDYKSAADAFERGSHTPNANPYLKMLAGNMAQYAGDYRMAMTLWQATYDTTIDHSIKINAAAHIRAIIVDQTIIKLEEMMAQYQRQTGRPAHSFSDLISASMIAKAPLDPTGVPYNFTPDGRIELRHPDDFPYVHKGLPPGYVPPRKPKFLPID